MDIERIFVRLDELTQIARQRKGQCWGAEIDFMTSEERQERHDLICQLPTMAEEREAARMRIRNRLAARKGRGRYGIAK